MHMIYWSETHLQTAQNSSVNYQEHRLDLGIHWQLVWMRNTNFPNKSQTCILTITGTWLRLSLPGFNQIPLPLKLHHYQYKFHKSFHNNHLVVVHIRLLHLKSKNSSVWMQRNAACSGVATICPPSPASDDLNSHPQLSAWMVTAHVSDAGHRTPFIYQVWSS